MDGWMDGLEGLLRAFLRAFQLEKCFSLPLKNVQKILFCSFFVIYKMEPKRQVGHSLPRTAMSGEL